MWCLSSTLPVLTVFVVAIKVPVYFCGLSAFCGWNLQVSLARTHRNCHTCHLWKRKEGVALLLCFCLSACRLLLSHGNWSGVLSAWKSKVKFGSELIRVDLQSFLHNVVFLQYRASMASVKGSFFYLFFVCFHRVVLIEIYSRLDFRLSCVSFPHMIWYVSWYMVHKPTHKRFN